MICPSLIDCIDDAGILRAKVLEWLSLPTVEERDEFYVREFMDMSADDYERFVEIAMIEMTRCANG